MLPEVLSKQGANHRKRATGRSFRLPHSPLPAHESPPGCAGGPQMWPVANRCGCSPFRCHATLLLDLSESFFKPRGISVGSCSECFTDAGERRAFSNHPQSLSTVIVDDRTQCDGGRRPSDRLEGGGFDGAPQLLFRWAGGPVTSGVDRRTKLRCPFADGSLGPLLIS